MAKKHNLNSMTRRRFLGTAVAAAGSAVMGTGTCSTAADSEKKQMPNILFIVCDQLSLDSIRAYGCSHVRTPNIDRLIARGTGFLESYSTSPVCSPARSSLLTGRMPAETGVIKNDLAIHTSIPNLGQWFRSFGYETVYCGKWHLPEVYPITLDGFDVLPSSSWPAQGDLTDGIVSRNCQAYLESYDGSKPFLLVASFMQPHDICYWAMYHKRLVPEQSQFKLYESELPPLPENWNQIPVEPTKLKAERYERFNDYQWRYYAYIYYRQAEMLDADVGRILDALDHSEQKDNTIIVFTSDHGEGLGRHRLVEKWHPYEESMKVPLVIAAPAGVKRGCTDSTHLVSGIDIVPTLCEFAGIPVPKDCCGLSLKNLLEGKSPPWRKFLSADTKFSGQILRTEAYKYVSYRGDPVEMLFDMKKDPGETHNLYKDPACTEILIRHRKLLEEWNANLKPIKPDPAAV